MLIMHSACNLLILGGGQCVANNSIVNIVQVLLYSNVQFPINIVITSTAVIMPEHMSNVAEILRQAEASFMLIISFSSEIAVVKLLAEHICRIGFDMLLTRFIFGYLKCIKCYAPIS